MSSSEEEANLDAKEEEQEDESPRKRRASRGNVVSYNEDDNDYDDEEEGEEEEDEDDDEDDVPLASLKSPSPKKRAKAPAKKGAKATKGKATKKKSSSSASAKKKKAAASSSKSGSSDYSSPSFALYGSGSKKGELIQKLFKPPQNYDAMDGFPGVYICTQGEEVGTIKDMRDKDKAPNFNNFAKMNADDLRDLLVNALKEQKRQLVASEGKGTSTEKELDGMLKWAEKLNTSKADKEATTVLKAAKLSLPE
ncbi:MAG: hypothetical protein SGARI_004981 [Bacillariaceae sp.]